MSAHIEWVDVTGRVPVFIDEAEVTWFANDGQTFTPGNVGLFVGAGDDGAMLEGTRTELVDYLAHGLRQVIAHDATADLLGSLRAVRKAAYGDSNDDEIETLQDALANAMNLLTSFGIVDADAVAAINDADYSDDEYAS